jgi:hypothetical protein
MQANGPVACHPEVEGGFLVQPPRGAPVWALDEDADRANEKAAAAVLDCDLAPVRRGFDHAVTVTGV